MSTVTTILISVLVFGFLIFIHEFGHYITARLFKVKIFEFSIGMGPRLFSKVSKKTDIRYSVAALPIGGFVAMAGEDGESDDPNAFDKKPAWARFIVTAAGAFVNITMGFLAMLLLTSLVRIGGTTIADFRDLSEEGYEVSSSDYGLMKGDTVIAVNGKKVSIADELNYEIMRQGTKPLDITVIRDGEEIVIEDVMFPGATESGQSFGLCDLIIYETEKTPLSVINYSSRRSFLTVRMCWESIYDLVTGRYTLAAVSGPVGISSAIGEAARGGFASLLNIVVLISINLGVMNLLPIPALDGGRLLTILIEMITRRRMPKKVETVINGVGLALLLLLSVVIMIKDVVQLIV